METLTKLVFIVLITVSFVHSISKHPILIIISFDAFKYNYLNSNFTPYMKSILKEGTSAHHLVSIFSTKTYPNHFSIATGVYSEVHGVTGNSLYDPKLRKILNYSNSEMFHYNKEIEPLWIRNERLGNDRHSGVMMWIGGEYEYNGVTPTFLLPFNNSVNLKDRMDTAVNWIIHPTTPANLIFIYIEEPDYTGHIYGVGSSEIINRLRQLDDAIKYLDNELKKLSVYNKVNIVQISDHGMYNIKSSGIINITQHLEPGSYELAEKSPFLHIIPSLGKEQEVYNRLKNVSRLNQHFHIYNKSEMPDRWHIKKTDRCPPIIALADPGYVFDDFWQSINYYEKYENRTYHSSNEYGVHGYDYTMTDMAGFFMARGPAIRKNHTVPPFNNIDLYNLFCTILKISPASNNGSFINIREILQVSVVEHNINDGSFLSLIGLFAFGAILTILCLTCVGCTILCLMRSKRNSEGISAIEKRHGDEFDLKAFQNSEKFKEAQKLLVSDSEEN